MISDKQRRWWDEVDDIVVVFEFSDHPHKIEQKIKKRIAD
jgi:hypothetical protein